MSQGGCHPAFGDPSSVRGNRCLRMSVPGEKIRAGLGSMAGLGTSWATFDLQCSRRLPAALPARRLERTEGSARGGFIALVEDKDRHA